MKRKMAMASRSAMAICHDAPRFSLPHVPLEFLWVHVELSAVEPEQEVHGRRERDDEVMGL